VRRPRNADTRGSGIALLKLAHPPQYTAQHRNSTHLRAAWSLSYVADEHVGIIDFAYVQGHEIWNKVADVADRVVA
jgi:hypothetical protein